VSHSGDWVFLALAWERRVGIDVEAWRDLEYAVLAERAFAPEERAALAGASAAELAAMFFAIWTRKEALLKARGLGLGAFPLEGFAVEADPAASRPRVVRWQGEEEPSQRWTLFTLPVAERCSACVAVEGSDPETVLTVE
jgi:4'-phosphopantetheinyl transferase